MDILCVLSKSTPLGGCTFQKVCLVFVESMGTAEQLYNVMGHPPLLLHLHMNKLILYNEHCFITCSYSPMEGTFLHHVIKEV